MQYGRFAAVYDEFMSGVDYRAWADYIIRLISHSGSEVKSVFECGCGTGSISIPLKKAGFSITASDISDEMLSVAAEKARRAGVFIPFVRMDMRSIALHRPVDCIIACCDAVNYLASPEDALAFFTSAAASLRRGGLLLFDVSSEYKLMHVLGGNCFSDSRPDSVYFWRNNYDEASRLIEMELDFFVKSAKEPSLYERFTERHIQRAHGERELTELLGKAGFGEIRCFAFPVEEPPREDSERLQFAAVKA